MAIEDSKTIATTATGYLENRDDWTEQLARPMAALESVERTAAIGRVEPPGGVFRQ